MARKLRLWFERWWYRKPRNRLLLRMFDMIQHEKPKTAIEVLEGRRK